MNPAPPPKRPAVQLLLLGFLLIVFPLGSFLYLRAGWNYQLDSRNEMEPLGPAADLFDYPRPDSSIDIVFFAPTTGDDSINVSLRDIHEAFDDNPDVRFVAIGEASVPLFDDPAQLSYVPTTAVDAGAIRADTRFSRHCQSVPLPQRAYVDRSRRAGAALLQHPQRRRGRPPRGAGRPHHPAAQDRGRFPGAQPRTLMSIPAGYPDVLERRPELAKQLDTYAWGISIFITVAVVVMRYVKLSLPEGVDFLWLPPVYSTLNALAGVCLLFSLYFILRKNVRAHRGANALALFLSVLFILGYVLYHITTEPTSYGGTGAARTAYFVLLITHVVLAAVSLPLILFTFVRSYTGLITEHKRMARWVYPIWLYVCITGPICYLMLRPYYAS